jgi:hypothetical protein
MEALSVSEGQTGTDEKRADAVDTSTGATKLDNSIAERLRAAIVIRGEAMSETIKQLQHDLRNAAREAKGELVHLERILEPLEAYSRAFFAVFDITTVIDSLVGVESARVPDAIVKCLKANPKLADLATIRLDPASKEYTTIQSRIFEPLFSIYRSACLLAAEPALAVCLNVTTFRGENDTRFRSVFLPTTNVSRIICCLQLKWMNTSWPISCL